MFLIEGDADIMIDTIVFLFHERGGHDLRARSVLNDGGCGVKISCQVAALLPADRVFIIMNDTVCRSLLNRLFQIVCSRYDLCRDRLTAISGIIERSCSERPVTVLIKDHRT